MEILNKSNNIDKRLSYKLSNQTRRMSELVGAPLKIEAWMLYADKDLKTEEEKEVVSLLVEGTAYATISSSFVREFKKIVDIFGSDELPELEVISGRTKNGREFISVTVK